MNGLKDKKYLSVSRKRFEPITVFFSVALLAAVLISAVGVDTGLGIGLGSDNTIIRLYLTTFVVFSSLSVEPLAFCYFNSI